MREKKRSMVRKSGVLVGVAGHAAMGVALGLALAFIVTRAPWFGAVALINSGAAPRTAMPVIVGTFATVFGIGAALTGLLLMMDDD